MKKSTISEFLVILHKQSLYTVICVSDIEKSLLVHFDPFIYMIFKTFQKAIFLHSTFSQYCDYF